MFWATIYAAIDAAQLDAAQPIFSPTRARHSEQAGVRAVSCRRKGSSLVTATVFYLHGGAKARTIHFAACKAYQRPLLEIVSYSMLAGINALLSAAPPLTLTAIRYCLEGVAPLQRISGKSFPAAEAPDEFGTREEFHRESFAVAAAARRVILMGTTGAFTALLIFLFPPTFREFQPTNSKNSLFDVDTAPRC